MTSDVTPDDITPDDITPDDKDWTWVLDRSCPECGFETDGFERDELGARIRANASEWTAILARPPAEVRARPVPGQWSPLEYAAHVRDVFRLFHQRLQLMLETDDPIFANWDQDVTAVEDRYAEQDPAVVSIELVDAAAGLAAAFDRLNGDTVPGETWARVGRRSDGARFTVESFGRYLIHDPVHHVWDVRSAAAGRT